MFVAETVENVLKPKISFPVLSPDEKQRLLFEKGMDHFDGSYDDFFTWLQSFYKNDLDRIWDEVIESIYNSGYAPEDESGNYEEIDADWVINNWSVSEIIDLFLMGLTHEQLNSGLSYFVPGYVSESLRDIFKARDPKKIIKDLIDKGSIGDKYAVVIQLFEEDYDKLHEEFLDRGIDNEDLIDAYISHWGDFRRASSPERVHWILSDILQDHLDEITDEMVKKALS